MLLNFFGVGMGPEFDAPEEKAVEAPLEQEEKKPKAVKRKEAGEKKTALAKKRKVPASVAPPESFDQLGISPRLVASLESNLNITVPTPIQVLSTPPILRGRDVLLKSETGSGKTLAFLVPILETLTKSRIVRGDGTKVLILTPTRELASQILQVSESLTKSFAWIVPGSLMGGERKKSEKARLRKGVTVLVCTPGRLLDHLQHTESFQLAKLTHLVLDEADQLLDLGFEKDLRAIVAKLDAKQRQQPEKKQSEDGDEEDEEEEEEERPKRKHSGKPRLRQTVLVSATLENEGVTRLCGLVLHQPVHVGFDANKTQSKKEVENDQDDELGGEVAKQQEFLHPSTIEHYYMEVESRHRLVALAAFLRSNIQQAQAENKPFKCIVFMSSCDAVDFHFMLFGLTKWQSRTGDEVPFFSWPIWALHGRKEQRERQASFFAFGKATDGILICTDVAARGLDLPRVDWIVQYDPPVDLQAYTHRAGRTGRMGQSGKVVVFLLSSEIDFIPLVKVPITAMFLSRVLLSIGGKKFETDLVEPVAVADSSRAVTQLQAQFEALAKTNPELYRLAAAGFQAFVRAYATYPKDLKTIFHPKKLHVGHVARSFALREEPKKIKDLLFAKNNNNKKDGEDKKGSSSKKTKTQLTKDGKKRKTPKGAMMAKARDITSSVSEFTA